VTDDSDQVSGERELTPGDTPTGRLAGAAKLAGTVGLLGGGVGVLAGLRDTDAVDLVHSVAGVLTGILLLQCARQLGRSEEAREPVPAHLERALRSLWLFLLVQAFLIAVSVVLILGTQLR
jgi:hypothetical protein